MYRVRCAACHRWYPDVDTAAIVLPDGATIPAWICTTCAGRTEGEEPDA